MAGEFDIQRIPAGLQNLLSLFGGQGPKQLSPTLIGNLELLQSFGLQQKQVLFAVNAALAPVTALDLALTPANSWGVLFFGSIGCGSQAAMTQLAFRLSLQRGSSGVFQPVHTAFPPYAAYPAAQSVNTAWVPPYPVLLPPLSTLRGFLDLLVGVANASTSVQAEIGIFG